MATGNFLQFDDSSEGHEKFVVLFYIEPLTNEILTYDPKI